MVNHIRWQSARVKEMLNYRRVIILSGARQSGKTTLAQDIGLPNSIYRTLDDFEMQEAASIDPESFVAHGDELMIIDEIQKVPLLVQAVKKDVDENKTYGRFLLTGSVNIRSLPSVTESLAGRVSNIRLRPFCMAEKMNKSPDFLANAFTGVFKTCSEKYKKNDYIELALTGGYPEVYDLPKKQRVIWHEDYITTMLDRDLQDIMNIRRQDAMNKLLSILASWSTKEINIQAIGSDLSIERPTLQSYINALETLYVVDRLPSWGKTDYQAIRKKDKLIMSDTGLMASILGWDLEQIQFDSEKTGKLMETFAYQQLISCLEADENRCNISHYRDANKREIDFIIQDKKGHILGIEVKAGTGIKKSHFKHLEWFKNNMAQPDCFKGIMLYTGDEVLSYGDNLWAVPMNALWA